MKIPFYKIKLNTSFSDVLKNFKEDGMTEENQLLWSAFVKKLSRFGLQPESVPDQEKFYYYSSAIKDEEDLIVDGPKALEMLAAFPSSKIERVIETEVDPAKVFEQVASKAEAAFVGGQAVYNTKCDVHMPGSMLATYNEVQLLEDSCTEVLQASLAAGWRLIAACPQPDQRRPDYIMGRFNPEYDGDTSAKRKGAL